ncbi:MAG: DUF2127 domain-containing protein [Oxalobacteraceae bacterium]|nr:MAG: DUF2127 domain-containing protein [Oxalobacteraceae bacterium]
MTPAQQQIENVDAAAAAVTTHPIAEQKALRAIALFEAAKGLGALAVSVGLLTLVHADLRAIVVNLIGAVGLDPDAHYPAVLLHYVDIFTETNKVPLVLVVAAYVSVRLSEAWGLWFQRPWGEWLGALSGALYVPLEVRHLLLKQNWASALVLSFNVAVVSYLGWLLWRRRHPPREIHATSGV